MAKTRILRDVFSPVDLDPNRRCSDRHARVEFVQKLIDFVAKNKHPAQGCVASKIVAGSDAAKTNELLQNLAKVALLKLQERSRAASKSRAQPVRDVSATKQRLSASQQKPVPKDSPRRSSSRKSSEVQQQQQQQPKELDAREQVAHPARVEQATEEVTAKLLDKSEAENSAEDLVVELKNLGPKLEELAELDRCLRQKLQVVY